jgi:hypothetical protein
VSERIAPLVYGDRKKPASAAIAGGFLKTRKEKARVDDRHEPPLFTSRRHKVTCSSHNSPNSSASEAFSQLAMIVLTSRHCSHPVHVTGLEEKFLPLSDDELAQSITIILAAYSEKFAQLKGKAVRPELRDDSRRHFAMTLVEHLRRSNVHFFRRDHNYLSGNSKWFGPQK